MKKITENKLKDQQVRPVVGVCTGCFERADIEADIQSDYLHRLRQSFPQFDFETYSCLRLCPENRITLEVPRAGSDPQLAMARSLRFEDVAELISRLTASQNVDDNTGDRQ